jgi:Leucine-rich repeat (LRR) protein
LYGNLIETIDNLTGSLVTLTSLQLQSNKIKRLDKGLYSLKNLEYLRLDRNELTSIQPFEVTPLVNLVYLNISNNKLGSINVSFS